MSFTRAFLKSLGLNDDQVQAVVDAHLEVVNPLKEERNTLKEQSGRIPELEKELEGLKNGEDFKAKWEKEHAEFEDYKKQVEQEAETAKVKAAYRKLLADEKISEKRLDVVMRATDFSKMKLDKDGNLTNTDTLKEAINQEWGDFKVKIEERKPIVPTPPNPDNGGKPASRARELANQYYAQKYGAEKENGV